MLTCLIIIIILSFTIHVYNYVTYQSKQKAKQTSSGSTQIIYPSKSSTPEVNANVVALAWI